MHGRTYAEERHSPLDQINTSNVDQIGLSWSFETGTNRVMKLLDCKRWSHVYNSAMECSACTGCKNGDLIWTHDPKVERAWANNACCDVVNRGVALYENSIFFGTIDGRLISLDKDTGTENWSILTIDKSRPYTITGAPRIVKGNVIIGNGGGEFGVRGYVTAYDVDSGDELWRFYTVPGNPNEPFESPEMEMLPKPGRVENGGNTVAVELFGIPWPMTQPLILYILVQVMVRHGIDTSEALEEIIYTFHPL